MSKVKIIAIVSAIALIVILFFQNLESVDTRILIWTVSMPRVFWLGFTLIIGVIAGYLIRVYQDLTENSIDQLPKKPFNRKK